MRLPHPPESQRFYADPYRRLLECPACGKLLRLERSPKGTKQPTFDPRTSRLRCTECGKVFVIGLVAWPVRQGSGQTATKPRDQVPNERQLGELRAGGLGCWLGSDQPKPARRPDNTNITASCTCRYGTAGTPAQDPNCPMHGGDEVGSG